MLGWGTKPNNLVLHNQVLTIWASHWPPGKENFDKMQSLDEIKKSLINQKILLSEKYKINRLGIFGSYVRGEQKKESDLDVLIDYEEVPSLITLIELENHLSNVLGLNVDLVTRKGIKPQLRSNILEEVVYL